MQLRPYQAAALEGVQTEYRAGRRRVLLVAPTGAGKSAMTRHMIGRTTKRTLILCHRENLRDMISEDLGLPHDVLGGTRKPLRTNVQVGMMQTVANRLDDLPMYDWVISDEAHLAMCATWRRILQHYRNAWHLGLSATPCRLDGQGLGAEYEHIVYGPTIRELTERGYLVPSRVFAPPTALLPGKSGNEYSIASDALELDKASVTGDVIEHWRRLALGKLTLGFCSSRDHAKHCAEQFTAAGIPARYLDGSMSPDDQRRILASFRARQFLVLFNVELLTTGFDCPEIECLLLLRRTKSLALYLQMIGRALRLFTGKTHALILDHVGNVIEHGMPDIDRAFSLDGRLIRAKAQAVSQCPKCFASHRPAPRCPSCGHLYAIAAVAKARTAPEARDGRLEEIDGANLEQLGGIKLKQALRAALALTPDSKAREALRDIQQKMGYANGWTHMQMTMRNRFRRPGGAHATVSRGRVPS